MLAAVVLPWTGSADEFATPAAPLMLGAATMIVIVVLAIVMPARTAVGATAFAFDAGDFRSRLGVMSAAAASAMTSSPRLSGDSGCGGGGGGVGSGWCRRRWHDVRSMSHRIIRQADRPFEVAATDDCSAGR